MSGTVVHLVDGTYELFRHHFALPSHRTADGREVAALRGAAGSILRIVEEGATHVAVATDHVIESFRNELWEGYKTSEGVPPELLGQFPLYEEVLRALGFVVWPMVEHEADDALASAARKLVGDERVERIVICSPDKDLAQCLDPDGKVVLLDRRKGEFRDREWVIANFGVEPASVPDWLALVGDKADGIPGVPGWGKSSAAALLAAYGSLDDIPDDPKAWRVKVRGAERLAASLREHSQEVQLWRRLARLVDSLFVFDDVDELAWRGPAPDAEAVCSQADAAGLLERARRITRSVPG
ncbi:MAG: hypothetical protein KatS3mg008_1263 [Acidimicrobiales bacterium]|nr:MAG: hypothetical protein KatS3mg008_1263 [Acidimicrobiales bacterium]